MNCFLLVVTVAVFLAWHLGRTQRDVDRLERRVRALEETKK